MNITVKDLVERLDTMPAGTIRQAGSLVRSERRSAADEIAWWNATVRVETLVRYQHQRLAAAKAAGAAIRAVRHAAERSGLPVDDPDVTAVARAASDAAGALVAGQSAVDQSRYFIDRLGPSFALLAA